MEYQQKLENPEIQIYQSGAAWYTLTGPWGRRRMNINESLISVHHYILHLSENIKQGCSFRSIKEAACTNYLKIWLSIVDLL